MLRGCFWLMLDLIALRIIFDERNTTGHLKERCGNLSGRFPQRTVAAAAAAAAVGPFAGVL